MFKRLLSAVLKLQIDEKTYLTSSSIKTRLVRAFIGHPAFTVCASVARWAAAGIRPLSSVEAGGSIAARFVVGAVVQVLVAEETTPTFVAVALPRLLARTVKAARVTDALIAQLALPT